MNLKKLILEHYGDTDDILFADGLDDAIIGFELKGFGNTLNYKP